MPASPFVVKGATQPLTATGTYTDKSTRDLTAQVSWASANTNIATVSSAAGTQGLASGVGVGAATISATLGGKSGSVTLTVWLGLGAASFFAAVPGPQFVAVADFNGDGKPDVVVANYSSNGITVLLGQ